MLAVTLPEFPLVWEIFVTVIVSTSTSLSSFKTSSSDPVTVVADPSVAVSVSLTAVGASFAPRIVILITAVSVAVPSDTV